MIWQTCHVEDDTSDEGCWGFWTTEELYAFVKIPDGWKATHVQVHKRLYLQRSKCKFYNIKQVFCGFCSNGDFNANIDITDISAAPRKTSDWSNLPQLYSCLWRQ